MLDANPTEVWAFHNRIKESKGTANMIMIAQKAKIPVKIFTEQSE
jgi:hypothetical protein